MARCSDTTPEGEDRGLLQGVSVLVPAVVTCWGRADPSSSYWAPEMLGRVVGWWMRLGLVVMNHSTG